VRKEDILAKLPEDARNLVGIAERKDFWILAHPYIEDSNLYANLLTAIEKLGGKMPGQWRDNAVHYEIPKGTESGVVPNVVKDDKSKPPDLGIDSEAAYKEPENAVPSEPYDLKLSVEKLGKLCPVLLDKNGHVIDGNHRMKLDPKWPTVTLSNIDTPVKRGLARIASNFCRRTVDAEELTREITMLIGYGLKPKQISELTGISERTIYRHLPEHLKTEKAKAISEAMKEKSDIVRKELTPVSSSITIQDKPQVVCEGCGVGTREPVIWHSRTLCPECNRKALLNPELMERKFPRNKIPEKIEPRQIKSTETWTERKAVMSPQHSKMEQNILMKLQETEIRPIARDRSFCLQSTVPDFFFPNKNLAVYLDGPVHEGKEDRDDRLRELLAKRHGVHVVSIPYKTSGAGETERVFKEIMEALGSE